MNNNEALKVPGYFHREYANDFPQEISDYSSQALRVVKVALPFVALYQPFGKALAGGLGVVRTASSLRDCFSSKDYQQLSWAMLNSSLALVSVAGTIFLHPLGMMITTLSDLGMNMHHVYGAINRGEMCEAGRQTMRVANNTFYLAMMVTGSIQLQLASLGIQVVFEGLSSYEEFNKGNVLELVGHLGMCMVRMNQSYHQVGVLQNQWKADALAQKKITKLNPSQAVPKPTDSPTKEASYFEAAAAEEGKWRPELKALQEQHKGHLVFANFGTIDEDGDKEGLIGEINGLIPEIKAIGSDGDLVAVWKDADASAFSPKGLGDLRYAEEFFANSEQVLCCSQYSASTGLWSTPKEMAIDSTYEWSLMGADPVGNALVLLTNWDREVLETVSFNQVAGSWSKPVELTNYLPEVKAFSADSLGNCTFAWNGEGSLFTARSYDAATHSWGQPFVSAPLSNEPTINLVVERDLDGYVAVLAQSRDHESHGPIWASVYDANLQEWSCRGIDSNDYIYSLVSMGKGEFITVCNGEESIYSVLFTKNSSETQLILSSKGIETEDLVVSKDVSGNPVVAWKETPNPEFETGSSDLTEKNWEEFFASWFKDLFAQLESSKIAVARFDSATKEWKHSEAASFMVGHPKLAQVGEHLYIFWEDFLSLKESSEYSPSDDKIYPVTFSGMRLNEATGSWDSLGTLFECSMPYTPLDNMTSPEGVYYSKSIDDSGLHIVWRDEDRYFMKDIPISN